MSLRRTLIAGKVTAELITNPVQACARGKDGRCRIEHPGNDMGEHKRPNRQIQHRLLRSRSDPTGGAKRTVNVSFLDVTSTKGHATVIYSAGDHRYGRR